MPGLHQRVEPLGPDELLVVAVLEDRSEGAVGGGLHLGGRERAGQLSDSDDHQARWLSILVDVDRHCLGKIERAA